MKTSRRRQVSLHFSQPLGLPPPKLSDGKNTSNKSPFRSTCQPMVEFQKWTEREIGPSGCACYATHAKTEEDSIQSRVRLRAGGSIAKRSGPPTQHMRLATYRTVHSTVQCTLDMSKKKLSRFRLSFHFSMCKTKKKSPEY